MGAFSTDCGEAQVKERVKARCHYRVRNNVRGTKRYLAQQGREN